MSKILDYYKWEQNFINKAKEKYGDKFDYSKVKFIPHHRLITIICKEHGEFQQSPQNHLNHKYCCPKCVKSYGSKIIDISGQTFGNLTVIKLAYSDKKGKTVWQCRCKCGKITNIPKHNLCSGQQSCSCAHHKLGSNNARWSGFNEISGDFWSVIQRNAKARNIEFNLTIEDMWDLYIKQNKQCYLSGQILHFSRNVKLDKRGNISLDRIDSNNGYTLDNVQWLHKTVNMCKQQLNNDNFIELCNDVFSFNYDKNNYKQKEIILENRNFTCGKYHKNWRGYEDIPASYICSVKHGAKYRDIEFSINEKYLWELFLLQNKSCKLSGRLISFSSNRRKVNGTASLDRINSDIGYIEGNVQWTHKDVNLCKQSSKDIDFVNMCKLIHDHIGNK